MCHRTWQYLDHTVLSTYKDANIYLDVYGHIFPSLELF